MCADSNIKFIQAIISFIALTGMKVPTYSVKKIYITCVLILILMIASFSESISEYQYKNEIKYVIWWYCQLGRSLERQGFSMHLGEGGSIGMPGQITKPYYVRCGMSQGGSYHFESRKKCTSWILWFISYN